MNHTLFSWGHNGYWFCTESPIGYYHSTVHMLYFITVKFATVDS